MWGTFRKRLSPSFHNGNALDPLPLLTLQPALHLPFESTLMDRAQILAALLILFAPAFAATSQSQSQSDPAPQSAPKTETASHSAQKAPGQSPKSAAPDYSNEAFVIEKYSTAVRFENDGSGERDLDVRVRVQNELGARRLAELLFSYNSANEKAEVRYLRVKKSDGSTVTGDASAVTDVVPENLRDAPAYASYKEKHIKVPGLQPGETIEYGITTRLFKPFVPGQFWYDHNFIDSAVVLDERLEINLPASRKVVLRSADTHYTHEQSSDRIVYRWKQANLATQPATGADDSTEEAAPKKPGAGGPDTPAVELTTFGSWDGIGKWYATLEHDASVITPELRAKALELTRDRASRVEKIRAVDDFVSKKIREVSLAFGLDGYAPHPAAEILARGYGDSKDKEALLAALLAAIGERVDATLVSTSRRIDPAAPSPSQFDRVIVCISSNAGTTEPIWLDPTSAVAPFRYLIPNLRGKKALRIAADGHAILAETPKDPPFLSTQDVTVEGRVSDLGKLTAKIHYRLRGDNEYAFRTALHRATQEQWKQLGQTVAMLDGFHGEVSKLDASDPTATDKPLDLTLDYAQKGFLDWSLKSSKVAVPLPALGLPDMPSERNAPVSLGSPLAVTLRLEVGFPASESVRVPAGVSVSRDYAEYHSSYAVRGNVLTVERAIRFEAHELPASRADDYQAFARAVLGDGNQVISIENPDASPAKIPPGAKPEELVEAGAAALDAGDAERALDLLHRAAELDPNRKDLWNTLGLAQLRLDQYDDAIASFHKQIEINPDDDVVYNYLGVTLVRQQKLDDAAAAFRKQIEKKPLDKFARASLGLLLVQQKKYKEAIPELDRAAVLAPENAQLQMTLADAYVNVGNKKDAAAAYENAAKISPSPENLNNVAYAMAEHRLDLERAEDFAVSAVNAMTKALAAADLDHLTDLDLLEVQNVGAYWDTLGWIQMRRGDLNAAEPYLRAAWKLTQHGEIGDHLGQLYEVRGEKELAARSFLLALAAPHALPETQSRYQAVAYGKSPSDDDLKQARADLASERIHSIKNAGTEGADAEFWLLVVPTEKGSRADAIKFIGGSESLKRYAETLRTIDLGMMFPNASSGKLIRRGKLACTSKAVECSFILNRPEEVRSVE